MENYREPQENTVLILLINWSIVNFLTYEVNFLSKGYLITWNFGDTLI